MYIPRHYQNLIEHLKPGKVLVIFGPRRVGKTTLVKRFLEKTTLFYRYETGDDLRVQEVLSSQNLDLLTSYVKDYELLVVDEAQYVPNIGMGLKMIVDARPDIKVIATGSSSFELANQIGEPLTGRKRTLQLFPLAQLELLGTLGNKYDLKQKLEEFLIYGTYPEVLTTESAAREKEKAVFLNEITNSYLLKDLLALQQVKSSKVLVNLLELLAFQIGSEVSHHELGQQLGLDKNTVARYLDLLEKAFVLINVRGFSRNLRKEISKKSRYFFYDTGIRNAIISNFNSLTRRDDVGMLWENFIVTERLKYQEYKNLYTNNYFWRTWDQKEIDWVEEREGKLFGYEVKWGADKIKPPKDWLSTYSKANFEVITRDNYLDFIT